MKLPPRRELKVANAPVSRVENGDYPREWSLWEFTHANAYFDVAPRPLIARSAWWLAMALLGVALVALGCWFLLVLTPQTLDDKQFKETYMLASIAPFGVLLFYTSCAKLRAFNVWRNANIAPARIEVVHQGVAMPTWASLAAGAALGVVGSLVAAAIQVFFLASLQIVTVENGRRIRRTIRVNRNDTSALRGDVLWVAIAPSGRCLALWDLSLDTLQASRVPLNVKSWFADALREAHDDGPNDKHLENVFSAEQQQAAEANTRAMKRAGRE
ncbi:MAG: hypothetical protein IPK87_04720 [Planctomycetes bacterium]|nr:hypothetical protein [Planctomycetota bacterium]